MAGRRKWAGLRLSAGAARAGTSVGERARGTRGQVPGHLAAHLRERLRKFPPPPPVPHALLYRVTGSPAACPASGMPRTTPGLLPEPPSSELEPVGARRHPVRRRQEERPAQRWDRTGQLGPRRREGLGGRSADSSPSKKLAAKAPLMAFPLGGARAPGERAGPPEGPQGVSGGFEFLVRLNSLPSRATTQSACGGGRGDFCPLAEEPVPLCPWRGGRGVGAPREAR